MARRKRRTSRKGRRRMSGTGSPGLQILAGVAIGTLGGAFLNTKLAAMTKPIDPKILALVELLGGGFISAKLAKGNPLMVGIGLGVAASGTMNLGKSFGIIGAFPNVQVLNGANRKFIRGLADRPALAGAYNPHSRSQSVLNGMKMSFANPCGNGNDSAM